MIPRLRAIVIALILGPVLQVLAQDAAPVAPTGSTAPSVQSAPVAGPEKANPTRNDQDATRDAAAQHGSSKPPENESGSRDRGGRDDGKGVGHGGKHTPEETVAEFTIYLAGATIALVIATIVLAAATIGLWQQTRRLAEQAVEASRDTKQSIKIAERSALETARAAQAAVDAVNAERAWVTFERPLISVSSTGTAPDGTVYENAIGIGIEWINSGRTPAIQIGLIIDSSIIEMGRDIPKFTKTFDELPRNGTFGPGRGGASPAYWMYGVEHERFLRREVVLVLYGKAIYSYPGNAGPEAISEVCIALAWNGEKTDLNGVVHPNIETGIVGQQNTLT